MSSTKKQLLSRIKLKNLPPTLRERYPTKKSLQSLTKPMLEAMLAESVPSQTPAQVVSSLPVELKRKIKTNKLKAELHELLVAFDIKARQLYTNDLAPELGRFRCTHFSPSSARIRRVYELLPIDTFESIDHLYLTQVLFNVRCDRNQELLGQFYVHGVASKLRLDYYKLRKLKNKLFNEA